MKPNDELVRNLREQLRTTEAKLNEANRLINSLTSEQHRSSRRQDETAKRCRLNAALEALQPDRALLAGQQPSDERYTTMWLCRWPDGDVFFVEADDRADAIQVLDELGEAAPENITPVYGSFAVGYRVAPTGLALSETPFCENLWPYIYGAYPALAEVDMFMATEEEAGRIVSDATHRDLMAKAAKTERDRIGGPVAECSECGASLVDGEGYNGKCGACADRASIANGVQ